MSEGTIDDVLAGRATWSVVCGDAVEVTGGLPEACANLCYCDPPYGLSEQRTSDVVACLGAWMRGEVYTHQRAGFMGKGWDAFVPGPEAWRAVHRALKPGGYCVAFSSTRTVDLLGIAVRLAGFEMRQGWSWIGGQGFPKSLDVSKAIDHAGGDDPALIGEWLRRERESRGMTPEDVAASIGCSAASVRNWELGRAREQGGPIEHITPGPKYRDRIHGLFGYPADERRIVGEATDRRGDGSSIGLGHSGTRRSGGNTDAAVQWEGYGTDVKPAVEPIVVARKELDGTVAENAQRHGCGALNIDAARISGGPSPSVARRDSSARSGNAPVGRGDTPSGWSDRTDPARYTAPRASEQLGRFPAALALVHEEGCELVGHTKVRGDARQGGGTRPGGFGNVGSASGDGVMCSRGYGDTDGLETVDDWRCVDGCPVRVLAEQSGQLASGVGAVKKTTADGHKSHSIGTESRPEGTPMISYGDTGSAARFFYQAKASSADRLVYITCSAGCTHHERVTNVRGARSSARNATREHPHGFCCVCGTKRNHYQHPTVKPLGLARYHAQLLSLPAHVEPIALVPYCGTGIEARALLDAGFRVIAVDIDPRHVAMARHRLATHPGTADAPSRPTNTTTEPKTTEARPALPTVARSHAAQLTLFGDEPPPARSRR